MQDYAIVNVSFQDLTPFLQIEYSNYDAKKTFLANVVLLNLVLIPPTQGGLYEEW